MAGAAQSMFCLLGQVLGRFDFLDDKSDWKGHALCMRVGVALAWGPELAWRGLLERYKSELRS